MQKHDEIKDSTYLDIKEFLSEYWRTLIDRETRSIEGSTEHLDTHRHAHDITCELDCCANIVNICGTFENLQNNKGKSLV